MGKQEESTGFDFISEANLNLLQRLSEDKWRLTKTSTASFKLVEGEWCVVIYSHRCRDRKQKVKESTDGFLYVQVGVNKAEVISSFQPEQARLRACVIWNTGLTSIATRHGVTFEAGEPKSWTRKDPTVPCKPANPELDERAQEILAECRKYFAGHESRIIEFTSKLGCKIMWSTIPEELKQRFNCTDVKTLESWGHKINFSTLKPGMRVKVQIDSVNCKGRNESRPLLMGKLVEVYPFASF